MARWEIPVVCCLALVAQLTGAAAQRSVARGTHFNTTSGQLLNLTLSIVQGTAATSSPHYCSVSGLPFPYTSYALDGAAPEINKSDPYALLYIDVPAGVVVNVTLQGGNITTQGLVPPPPPEKGIVTVDFPTAGRMTTAPLFIALNENGTAGTPNNAQLPPKSPSLLGSVTYSPSAPGLARNLSGGLTSDLSAGPSCIYAISFLAV